MSKLSEAPAVLPDEMPDRLIGAAEVWRSSTQRPSLQKDDKEYWDDLILKWAENDKMPLLVRKGTIRGKEVSHSSGRILVSVDNSPAQWLFTTVYDQKRLNLSDIEQLLKTDSIPMAFSSKNKSEENPEYKCTLSRVIKEIDLNKKNWKLSHIIDIGLKTKTKLEIIPIDDLKSHFIKLMSPSNMFLVPKKWAGLGELPEFIESFKEQIGDNLIKFCTHDIQKRGSAMKNVSGKEKAIYPFNGQEYVIKRRLVHAVIKEHIRLNPKLACKRLQELFPKRIQKQGREIILPIEEAQEINAKGVKRYFTNKNELLTAGDGTSIAVCTQWGIRPDDNTDAFIEHAKSLGYKIEKK